MLILKLYHRDGMLKEGILSADERGVETLCELSEVDSVFILEFESGRMIDVGLAEIMIYNS